MYRHFLIEEKFDNIGPQAEMYSSVCRLYWLTQIRTDISKVRQSNVVLAHAVKARAGAVLKLQ